MKISKIKVKKEWVGRVFSLGTQYKEGPREVNGVLGSYLKFYGEAENHGAVPIVLNKSVNLPAAEVELDFDEVYLVADKVRITDRETNENGQTRTNVNGYLEFSLYLTKVKVKGAE